MMFVLRKQMCRLHLLALGAGIANSMFYFIHAANFGYGSQLVENGEMRFDQVLR